MGRQKEEKKEAILNAAFEIFKKYGLKKATLDDIAREAGMANTSLYYYFSNKDDLFQALIRRECESMLEQEKKAIAEAHNPKDKFSASWTTFRSMLEYHFDSLSTNEFKNLRESIWEAHEFVNKYQNEHEQLIKQVLQAGIEQSVFKKCDVGLVATSVSACRKGLFQEFIESEMPIDRMSKVMDSLLDLILHGLENTRVGRVGTEE
ncbi:MAG: TetR/AcrR family transcriptional regulator [Deltaproteobacteria bacterium]|nr:TetR/AcrR family transcriptional regulator [Deltaproteobacteria bacterium]